MKQPQHQPSPLPLFKGFTLVELLVVVAIVSILASMVVTAVSNAAVDSSRVVARQQQASVQQALSNWLTFYSTTPGGSLASTRVVYSNAESNLAKLALISGYIDPATYNHLLSNSSETEVRSSALTRAGAYLSFSGWTVGGYPSVDWNEDE